ncbi:MAG TPA: hypothetical protein VHH35_08950, partial [Pyrinomonadaceae bacterium]|nr:hypothetical protein [Pyrinomonadaceae bacterium]
TKQSTKYKAQSTNRMSQLQTLIWLKWRLLRNSLRSRKAVVNKLASVLGMLAALGFSLIVALSLGVTAYALTRPGALNEVFRRSSRGEVAAGATTEFIFFSILGFLYLMWATVPLSIGGSKQFDAGKLLMYPITLRKLFAVDFVSELTTLHSVFAVPAILAVSIGAGLGSGNLAIALLGAIPATLFGLSLSKWLSTTIGSLLQRKRARGETIVALTGAVAGLGGALIGQVAPILFRHAESLRSLRWTPPGAAAVLFAGGARSSLEYVLAFATLSGYTIVLIAGTYWMARRSALGLGGRRRAKATAATLDAPFYSGWQLPLVSAELSAVIEKELRYAMRNAQIRMMALMPLILIVIRLFNRGNLGDVRSSAQAGEFITYLSGLLATGGVLYVFLILGGISANLFAFEEGGMRSYILSPIDRRKILVGKNISVTVVACIFAVVLLALNAIVFRDTSAGDLVFVMFSFVVFAAIMSIYGNWVSIRFPKRMKFGKRMNVSGVAGLLLIPMIVVLATPPFLAALVGYLTRNVYLSYATLALFALLGVGIYGIAINFQGRLLARREIEILETVREQSDE